MDDVSFIKSEKATVEGTHFGVELDGRLYRTICRISQYYGKRPTAQLEWEGVGTLVILATGERLPFKFSAFGTEELGDALFQIQRGPREEKREVSPAKRAQFVDYALELVSKSVFWGWERGVVPYVILGRHEPQRMEAAGLFPETAGQWRLPNLVFN